MYKRQVLDGNRNYKVQLRAVSNDTNYDGVTSATLTCVVLEDDVAFATVSGKKLTVGAGVDGPTFGDGYSITLSAPPKADVFVALNIDDAKVKVNPRTLVFTPSNWDPQAVEVNASLYKGENNTYIMDSRMALLTHTMTSEDTFFDGIEVASVDVAVEFSADSVPPPKLEEVRFLDEGNGLNVRFDSATNQVDGAWDIDCAKLFKYDEYQFGTEATCSWYNHTVLKVTFSSGASIVPFDYVNATKDNAVYLIGGVLKTNIDGATLTSVSQYAEAQKPWNPVAPSISITAPLSVGVCDGISLDLSLIHI